MMRKHHPIYAGLIALIFLLLPLTVTSSAADPAQISNHADAILYGRVTKVECRWAKSSLNILSHTQFQVKICIKGEYTAGDHVEIESYGGVIRGMKQKVPHCAAFQRGEYALVFLNKMQGDLYYVTDGEKGKIHLAGKKGIQSAAGRKKLNHMIRNIQLALKR